MRKTITYCLLFLFCTFSSKALEGGKEKVVKRLNDAVERGSASEIALYFDRIVEVEIKGQSNHYSRKQSEMIVHNFFKREKVLKYEVKHTGEANEGAVLFIIGELTTEQKETLHVYFLMKQSKPKHYKIQSLKIS